eukprot:3499503-Rhodomonas_salina.3
MVPTIVAEFSYNHDHATAISIKTIIILIFFFNNIIVIAADLLLPVEGIQRLVLSSRGKEKIEQKRKWEEEENGSRREEEEEARRKGMGRRKKKRVGRGGYRKWEEEREKSPGVQKPPSTRQLVPLNIADWVPGLGSLVPTEDLRVQAQHGYLDSVCGQCLASSLVPREAPGGCPGSQ